MRTIRNSYQIKCNILNVKTSYEPGLRRTSTSSPPWNSKFLVSILRVLLCVPTTNAMDLNQMSATTLGMRTTRFKDSERQGRRRPEEPCSRAPAMNWILNLLDVDSEWFAMYALTCIFWAILGTKMINSEPQHYNNWYIQKQILHFWSTCPNWNLWNISEFYDTWILNPPT